MGMKTRLELFPITTREVSAGDHTHLVIGGCNLELLAEYYGTPLYLYDRATMDAAAQIYMEALGNLYPGDWGLTYAGKAFLCQAIAQWTQQQGFWIDCTGAGELHIAASAGTPRQHLLMHGVNKNPEDLEAACREAGTLVLDNLDELRRVALLLDGKNQRPNLWLRLRPGLAVDTHAYTQTGQNDSKFGLSPDEFETAVRFCCERGLPLTGLHFHQGSHFHDPAPLGPAIATALDLVSHLRESTGWMPRVFCPGGGWGVAYHEAELPQPNVSEYVGYIARHLAEGCRARGLPLPTLQLEPGRSLVARAGVALYRVGSVKHTSHRRWLLMDGGLADNPRPAMYGARYSALAVTNPSRPATDEAALAGPFCESGDVLIQALPMPDVQPGELIAVPVSGAYQLSMGSNYNGARRPAVLLLDSGKPHLIQRRETLDDLVLRDLPLV